ncbi:MAG: peptidoglycan editing factor PgeF [Nitrospirae bacterium]|nr:peptidoglycan editing factor PgeF [Nitrospirota bacterium]MBF0535959.1 peptidoglycan editing factor PgeF [Nitrospirota bacterium]MBF0618065.1 peptidoglycan editing factor PgeF [Nitrospirota bacterium]
MLRTQNESVNNGYDLIYPEIFRHNEAEGFFTDGSRGLKIQDVADSSKPLYMPLQKHTDVVVVLRKGSSLPTPGTVADAVITDRDDIITGVQSADCVPILVFDRKRRVTGSIHAGWRGTAKGILSNVLRQFFSEFKSDAADVLIAIGPSIRGCCYEVGEEVISAVISASGEGDYIYTQPTGGKHIDLSVANKLQALRLGVNPENIWISPDCTYCVSKYHSYRRAQKQNTVTTGRQGAFITFSTCGDAA